MFLKVGFQIGLWYTTHFNADIQLAYQYLSILDSE